jgi:hypothetical protein
MFKKLVSYLSVTLLALVPSMVQASAPIPSHFLEDIMPGTQLPATGDYVFILSGGGSIDDAFRLAEQVKSKTCIVFAAASAALMIVLPSCKERYFVKGAVLAFHSAGIYLPPSYFLTEWDAAEFAKGLAEANLRIKSHMVLSGVPWDPTFIELAMRTDIVISGEDVGQWAAWLKPVDQCTHCPTWTQLVRLYLPAYL